MVEHLQVGRAGAQAQPGLAGEVLDAALALGEQVEQFQPFRAGQGLSGTGELLIQGLGNSAYLADLGTGGR